MLNKLALWLSPIVTLGISLYAGVSFVFYAWLSAVDPKNWPEEKAALWAYSSLAISVAFLGLCVYSTMRLVRYYKTNG
jgi:hypothetical protein